MMNSAVRVFLTLLVACLVSSCAREPEPLPEKVIRQVKTVVLGEAGARSARSFPGVVKASQVVDLAFQVSGPLVSLPILEGGEVLSGSLVAQIRQDDFLSAVQNSRGALDAARSQLEALAKGARDEDRKMLEAQLSAAQALFKESGTQYERYRNLLQEGVTPKSKFDEIEAGYEVAKAQLEAAHRELQKGLVGAREEDIAAKESEIEGLQAALDQANLNLKDASLRAPFSGVVAKIYVENFQNVQAKEPILSLQDVTNVEILINLPESDVITTTKEDVGRLYATFDALPEREFDLEIKEFGTEADPITQTYQATLTMPAPEDVKILPGMTASVRIEFRDPGEGAGGAWYTVPSSSVFSEGDGKSLVWKLDPSTMKVSPVETEIGEMAGDNARISGGVQPGDVLVTSGVHHLRDGMEVRRLGE